MRSCSAGSSGSSRCASSVSDGAVAMPASRSTALQTDLSIASAEPSTPAPTYGTSSISQQPLDGAVLAERAVQDRQHDVDVERRPGGGRHDRAATRRAAARRRRPPAAPSGPRGRSRWPARRSARDRAPRPRRRRRRARCRAPTTARPERTATRTRRCVTDRAARPTIVTVEPCGTVSALRAGRSTGRRRPASGRAIGTSATSTVNPRSSSAVAGVVLATGRATSGTRSCGGPDDTTIVTVEPLSALRFAPGSCEMTVPAAIVADGALSTDDHEARRPRSGGAPRPRAG